MEELQKTHQLNLKIEQFNNESLMGQNLTQSRKNIWTKIGETITEIWPSIQIIFEKQELINRSREVVRKIKIDLGQNPMDATTFIKLLHSKNREELEYLGIQDNT